MPAAIVFRDLNSMLADPSADAYRDAAAAVAAADSVSDALASSGVLELEDDPSIAIEASAVVRAIPPAVDEAIMGALESAFERAVPVSLGWTRGERISVSVSEQPSGVSIEFTSPHGGTFV